MAWNPKKCGTAMFVAGGKNFRTEARPNGFIWDEGPNLGSDFVKHCRHCAEINVQQNSEWCVIWNLEGEHLPGQPNWAYVGDPTRSPIPEQAIREGIGELYSKNIRAFCTLRWQPVLCDPIAEGTELPVRYYRSSGFDPYYRFLELIDKASQLGFSGAYVDSNTVPGLWTTSQRNNRPVPPTVPAGVITMAIDELNLKRFDVFCEYPCDKDDKWGIGRYYNPEDGDVRLVPGGKWIEQIAFRKRWPNAMRIIPVKASEMRPEREDEYVTAIKTGNIMMSDANIFDQRVADLYKKAGV